MLASRPAFYLLNTTVYMNTKKCISCKEVKLRSEFDFSKSSSDGLYAKCKLCKPKWKGTSSDRIRRKRNDGYKTCTLCNLEKKLSEFRVVKENSDGRDAQCLRCYTSIGSYSSNRDYYLIRNYGITYKEYLKIYKDQDSKCAICKIEFSLGTGKRDVLYVDHDHATGRVRGLLCASCNYMLGNSKDNPDILQAGIEYLSKYSPKK